MLPIIAGTIRNTVKLDFQAKSWEQKKRTGNVLTRKELNARANMTQEERQIEQFKEQMQQERENSKANAISNKIMNGEVLTPEEEQYLQRNNPLQLASYRRVQKEQHDYEKKLEKCKTKDEVQRLKLNTVNGYLSELNNAKGQAKYEKAREIIGKIVLIRKAEDKFVAEGKYEALPTEEELEVEKNQEIAEENQENIEEIKESVENSETEVKAENLDEVDNSEEVDSSEEVDTSVKPEASEKLETIERLNKAKKPDNTEKPKNVHPEIIISKRADEATQKLERECQKVLPHKIDRKL